MYVCMYDIWTAFCSLLLFLCMYVQYIGKGGGGDILPLKLSLFGQLDIEDILWDNG